MPQGLLNNQLGAAQAKAVEVAKHLTKVAVESAQALTEINQAAAKDALVAAQEANSQLLTIKDPQQLTKLVQPEVALEAVQHVAIYHAKVSNVIRNGGKQVAQVVDASIDDARDDLANFVNEATKSAPAGSETFVSAFKSIFETSLHQFDQLRASAATTFANFEKNVDSALATIQGQSGVAQSDVKTTPKLATKKSSKAD